MLKIFGELVIILALCAPALGCRTMPGHLQASDDGLLFLYLQPVPPGTEILDFEIVNIGAVTSDGLEYPLSFKPVAVAGADRKRQRLIAVGRLPEGEYSALSCSVGRASVKRPDRETALLPPARPVLTSVFFSITRRSSRVIVLTFDPARSVRDSYLFEPALSAYVPERPLIGLTGYIVNAAMDSLMVFNKNTMQVSGAVGTGNGPRMVAIDQGRRRAYAAAAGDDSIDIIDVSDEKIISTIRLNPGDRPQELALTPDGGSLIVANWGSDSVSIFDPLSGLERTRISVGQRPRALLIDRSGRQVYVFNSLSSTISVIDIQARSLIATATVEAEPVRGQFNRRGDRLYVVSARSPYLLVLDPASLAVVRREFIGAGAATLKVDPQTDLLYVAMRGEPAVGVYDPLSLTRGDIIPVGGSVVAMAIDGEENNLYLVVPDRRTVAVVSLVSRKIIAELEVSDGPAWAAMMGER